MTDDEDPLASDDDVAAVTPDPNRTFNRRGTMLSASAGIATCREPICADIKVGGHGRIELGYRLGRFAPFVGVSMGGSKVDVQDFSTPSDPVPAGGGSLRFFDVGAGVQFAPSKEGRLDPFFTAALGYSRVRERLESGADRFEIDISRGGVRLGSGLGVYVSRRIALAPRFDIVLPFAGKVCTVLEDVLSDIDEECSDVSQVVDAEESSLGERLARRTFPRPWSLALDLRVVF